MSAVNTLTKFEINRRYMGSWTSRTSCGIFIKGIWFDWLGDYIDHACTPSHPTPCVDWNI